MNIVGRLERARRRLAEVLSETYIGELQGTLGTDRL